MKTVLVRIGAVMLAGALISLLIGLWFRYLGHSVMDGSSALYGRLFSRASLFLKIGCSLMAGAVVLLTVCYLFFRHK
jgi:hypothetical protein